MPSSDPIRRIERCCVDPHLRQRWRWALIICDETVRRTVIRLTAKSLSARRSSTRCPLRSWEGEPFFSRRKDSGSAVLIDRLQGRYHQRHRIVPPRATETKAGTARGRQRPGLYRDRRLRACDSRRPSSPGESASETDLSGTVLPARQRIVVILGNTQERAFPVEDNL